MVWKGVILEESLEDKFLLDLVKIVNTKKEKLEGEDRVMTFHSVEIKDDKKDEFIEKAVESIKQSFYLHIVKQGVMYIVYRGKSFKVSKESEELKKARDYGKSIGILEEQLPTENLIDNPFG